MPFLVQKALQIRGVDEVPRMGKADSVRVIGEKRLFKNFELAFSLSDLLHGMRGLEQGAKGENSPPPNTPFGKRVWPSIKEITDWRRT